MAICDAARPQFSLGLASFVLTAFSVAFGLSATGVYPEQYPYLFWASGALLVVAFPFYVLRGLDGRQTFLVLLLFASILSIKMLALVMDFTNDADTSQTLLLAMRATGWLSCLWPPLILASCVMRFVSDTRRQENLAERNEEPPSSAR